MTRWFTVAPADAWFFRDARPFNQADPAQMAVPSLYPPNPTTVVGLLRAALARACGWSGRGPWQNEIAADMALLLGDGDDLGGLRLAGPYVMSGEGLLFAAPTLLFGREEGEGRDRAWTELVRLAPGPELRCDIGSAPVRLPSFERKPKSKEQPKPLFGKYFLKAAGIGELLRGGESAGGDIVARGGVAAPEPRVRLMLGEDNRNAVPGLLFTTEFVRPRATTLIVAVEGLDRGPMPHSPAAFGGENRWAWIGERSPLIRPPTADEFFRAGNGDILYTAILATSADLEAWPDPGEPLGALPGCVVSAALDRPLRPGEWRSEGAQPGPQESPPLLPAGSTWFLRAAADCENEVRAAHETKIGRRTAWGFGEVLIGTWRDVLAHGSEAA